MKLAALIKKEFSRFFRDPKLIVTMLFPGILIYAIYSLLATTMYSEELYEFRVYAAGSGSAVSETAYLMQVVAEENGWTLEWLTAEGDEAIAAAEEEIARGDATALLIYSAFDGDSGERPAVEIVYRSESEESTMFYSLASSILREYGMRFSMTSRDLTEGGAATQLMADMLPFLVVALVFSACMSITLESVAGEKERGTLATILVTSAKRSHIALGKVIPLSLIALIGAASSFLGVALSMPKLMGASLGSVVGGFGALSYLLVFLLIFSIVPLIVSCIAAVSTYAGSVKEASAYTGILMTLFMVSSIVSAFVSGIGDWVVAVPLLNAVVSMQGVLTGGSVLWQSLVSVGLNLVYTAILVFCTARMLASERIMFGK